MIGRFDGAVLLEACVVYLQECPLSFVYITRQACIYTHTYACINTKSGSLYYTMQSAVGSTEGDLYSEVWHTGKSAIPYHNNPYMTN